MIIIPKKIKKNSWSEEIIKKVFKREYKIQRIDGLEEKKVTPPEEVYERIKRENKSVAERSISTPERRKGDGKRTQWDAYGWDKRG